jgi:hypothetical protein
MTREIIKNIQRHERADREIKSIYLNTYLNIYLIEKISDSYGKLIPPKRCILVI